MPATIAECKLSPEVSRSTSGTTARRTYVIDGTEDPVVAIDLLDATAPATYLSVARATRSIRPVGLTQWTGEVTYQAATSGSRAPLDTGDGEWTFDTTGGTQHITTSKQEISKYGTSTDSHLIIGQDGEGVDIVSPVFRWSEPHAIAISTVNLAYRVAVANATGKVNNGTFRGFPAATVLFMGAQGQKRNDDDWLITFAFAYSPALSGVTVGASPYAITGIVKRGWDVMDVHWKPKPDDNAGRIRVPKAVYIQRVYDEVDMGVLGIGTGTEP